MCGIAGVWGRQDPELVEAMLEQVAHRGPDAHGLHDDPAGRGTLGHRRLSIVDVSGGDQPLLIEGGHRALVANGEIYNAPGIRADLEGRHRFATRSDSEVALHLHVEHGADLAEHLEGMFALGLVDDDGLLLVRDRIGIKPLYIGRHHGAVVFASEARALPPGTTHVEAVPPGTTFSPGEAFQSYWELPDPEPVGGDLADHAGAVRAGLAEAVEKRLMADVPVGAFLSGGLDSSAICALMRPHVDELHTFATGVAGSPDLAAARLVAEHLDTVHHEHVLDPDEIHADLPEIVAALGSFDQDLVRSAVPTWYTARLASKHLKVVLTGEGADEIFAGYKYYREFDDDELLHAELRRSLEGLHDVNLQRVDRMTMAHSLEARVPFLDVDLIETGLSIPMSSKLRPGQPEKLVLREAVADLLPHEVVWRTKAQFDEGSGAGALLEAALATEATMVDAAAYQDAHSDTWLRSAEECRYHQLLVDSVEDPDPVLATVGRWSDGRLHDEAA